MATQLKNIITFTAVAAGAQATLAHGLNINGEGAIPDKIDFDNGEFSFISADATNVTMQNVGAAPADADVLAEHWHTIDRVFGADNVTALTPQPFVGGGGGGNDTAEYLGTTGADVDVGSAVPPVAGQVLKATNATHASWLADSGVSNPLILATGNGTVTAPVGQASGAIGHGVDGDVGTADVQVDPAASGLAIGWVDSFAGGTAQVKAGGRASFAMGFANLLGAQTGEISTSLGGYGAMAFGQVVPRDSDAGIKAEDYGALAFGYAGNSINPGSYAANIQADGWGAFAGGYVFGYGSPGLIRAAWDGCMAFGSVWGGTIQAGVQAVGGRPGCIALGYVTYDGTIDAREQGAFAVGYAKNNGLVIAQGNGAMAQGYTKDTAKIDANGTGTFAGGYAHDTGGLIEAGGAGSMAHGNSVYGIIDTVDEGDHAFGCAEINGLIRARGKGAFTTGYATGAGSQLYSNYPGAFVSGFVKTSGDITATGKGAFARGYAWYSGGISASGPGSFASGYVYGATGDINAIGYGAHAFGVAWDDATLEARNTGSLVAGYARYGATIQTLDRGCFVLGLAQNDGFMSAGAYGALARGYADGAGSQVTADGKGALASGTAKSNADMLAFGSGGHTLGHCQDGSKIGTAASSYGCLAGGYASDGAALIYSRERGCFAFGVSRYDGDGGAGIIARGDGSFAMGDQSGGPNDSNAQIYANAAGGFAFGRAFNNAPIGALYSSIHATGDGALAQGFANAVGTILASGGGAHAGGYATSAFISAGTPAIVEATALGTFAHGVSKRESTVGAQSYMRAASPGAWAGGYAWGYDAATYSAKIEAQNQGSLAHGYARDAYLLAQQDGAHAFGRALAGCEITASGLGAFATGNVVGGGKLVSSGAGALAAGFANAGYDIRASGDGAFAVGRANTANVRASAINSVQFGEGTNAVADSMQVGSDFLAKANGQFGGANDALPLGAAATTFVTTSNVMTITGDVGANTIATITGGISGQELTLIFVDANVTITDDNTHAANTVDLAAAFTGADDTVLKLIFDGTSWYEVSRSVN